MNKMYSFTYLLIVISLIVHNQIDFIDATGDSKKIWLSDDKTGELETVGWEWHSVEKEFYENLTLTKNIFEFNPKREARINLNLDTANVKFKDYSFNDIESTGYSFYVYFSGDQTVKGSYRIDDFETETHTFKKRKWQKIAKEYQISNDTDESSNFERLVKFDFKMEFNYNILGDDGNAPYLAISKLHKYFKFNKKKSEQDSINSVNSVHTIFFNFTKNNTDYNVEVDKKSLDLSDFTFWTNLNFPNVTENGLQNLAVSKLNNSYMMLDKFKTSQNDFLNSSICLMMKYYHDVHDVSNMFEIVTKPRGDKDQNDKIFNKFIEYGSFRSKTNEIKQQNWLDLKFCFSKRFVVANVIYLVSTLDPELQLGQYPSLTNAVADFKIKHGTEHFNDFLYSWSTGFFDPFEEWYTTPILDNFRLKKIEKTNQTYLELINDQNSKTDVYHLISNSFRLRNDMKLTFNLENTHTDATIKIYLVEDTQKRKTIHQINLNVISEDQSFIINLTDSNLESNLAFNAINMDEEFKDTFSLDKGQLDTDKNDKEPNNQTDKVNKGQKKDDEEDKLKKKDQNENLYARLIFEFKLKSDENANVEKLTLLNLNLMDPCYLKFDECKYGKCISDSVGKWHCKCDDNAHGLNCEYLNMCKTKLDKLYVEKNKLILPEQDETSKEIVLNGHQYCINRKTKGCTPLADRIMCQCEEGKFWSYKTNECGKLDPCSYIYCEKDEECYIDEYKGPKCRCKPNHYRNESTMKCEPDYCRRGKNQKPICNEKQDCINDLINERAICECKFGFTAHKHGSVSECLPLFTNEKGKSPFMNQFYECEHTYELSNDEKEYLCKCFDGWRLQADKRSCKPEFDLKLCPDCTSRGVCIRSDSKQSNSTKCQCKVGYQVSSENKCEPVFCNDQIENRLTKLSCISGSCSLQSVRRLEPVFQCSCRTEFETFNESNGICEIKNVCNKIEQNKCAETNGYCIPKIVGGFLAPVCECSIGFGKDKENNNCVPLDQLIDCKRFNAFTKYIDVSKNRAVCSCLPGYVFETSKKKCVLSRKETVQVSVVVFLKHLTDDLDREEIPESAYKDRPNNQQNHFKLFDCNNARILSKEHCHQLINSAYEPLIKLNKTLMMRNVEYQLYQKVRSLFFYILGNYDEMSITMINYENVSEINEKENGFNTKYMVNIALVSDKIKEKDLQGYLDKMCQVKEIDEKDNLNKSDEFKYFCFLEKDILPVERKLNVIGQLNLCNLKTMQCPAYSTCEHEYKDNLNHYSCVCNKGFKSLHKIEEFNLDIEVCEDVDECLETDDQTHDCKENTICDNLIGSYRCLCKEGFKRVSETSCKKTCSEFQCVNGQCQTFEKHFEICNCNDGYKGVDCSKEDHLVILLKEILVFVSVGLGLMLVVVIAIAVFCIKSVRKQKRKDDDQICLDNLK